MLAQSDRRRTLLPHPSLSLVVNSHSSTYYFAANGDDGAIWWDNFITPPFSISLPRFSFLPSSVLSAHAKDWEASPQSWPRLLYYQNGDSTAEVLFPIILSDLRNFHRDNGPCSVSPWRIPPSSCSFMLPVLNFIGISITRRIQYQMGMFISNINKCRPTYFRAYSRISSPSRSWCWDDLWCSSLLSWEIEVFFETESVRRPR